MKIGDYIRTKKGNIGKVMYINQDNTAITTDYNINPNIAKCIHINHIIKFSSDILDLLKPMDLFYIDIDNSYAGGIIVPRIAETHCELKQIINEIKLGNYILKSVVTKEQIESCMYKVGD